MDVQIKDAIAVIDKVVNKRGVIVGLKKWQGMKARIVILEIEE